MRKRKGIGKKLLAFFLSAVMLAGNSIGATAPVPVYAMESENETVAKTLPEKKEISQADKNGSEREEETGYVLDRPMTEEEKREQLRITEYYNSMLSPIEMEEVMFEEQTEEAQKEDSMDDMEAFGMDAIQTPPASYSSRDLGYMPDVRTQVHGI